MCDPGFHICCMMTPAFSSSAVWCIFQPLHRWPGNIIKKSYCLCVPKNLHLDRNCHTKTTTTFVLSRSTVSVWILWKKAREPYTRRAYTVYHYSSSIENVSSLSMPSFRRHFEGWAQDWRKSDGCFSPNIISSPWRCYEDYNISFCKQWKFRFHCSYEQWHLNLHSLQRGPSCP